MIMLIIKLLLQITIEISRLLSLMIQIYQLSVTVRWPASQYKCIVQYTYIHASHYSTLYCIRKNKQCRNHALHILTTGWLKPPHPCYKGTH